MMKQVLLATVACLAISYPAMAQNSANGSQPSTQHESQSSQSRTEAANGSQGQNSQSQQAQSIQPSSLSKQEVRDIQMSLNKAGFSASSVDGIWGDEPRQALRNFQQVKKLPGNGELNQQTLAALGVNNSNSSQANNQNGGQNNASSGQQGKQNASSGSSGQSGQSQTVGESKGTGSGNNQASQNSGQNPSPKNK